MKVKSLSRVRLFATLWTVAYQAPPSMGFSRQEYWSGLPFPSPGDLPDPGIEPRSPTLEADALTSEPPGKRDMEFFAQTPWSCFQKVCRHHPWPHPPKGGLCHLCARLETRDMTSVSNMWTQILQCPPCTPEAPFCAGGARLGDEAGGLCAQSQFCSPHHVRGT